MTRDDIASMAREAGFIVDDCLSGPNVWVDDGYYIEELERFAALVAAHEREKVAAWMLRRSYATGHGDTVEDLLDELEWQVAEREREACAKLAGPHLGGAIAAAIRARGKP
jgi:hypothetical protein